MRAPVQITRSVKMFDHQRENDEEPMDQQAVFMVMGDVFESVAILGVIEPLVLNLPTALGEEIQLLGGNQERGEIGQPIRFTHCSIGSVLAVAENANRWPVQPFPWIKIVCIP